MPEIILPTTTMPGQKPQESGGRLINCFAESLGTSGPKEFKLLRAPGLLPFVTTAQTVYRGGLQVGSLLYTAWSGKAITTTSAGVITVLTGALTGTDGVFWARNNKSTPDVVAVSPANGAFEVSTTAVVAYTDSDVGSPNSVCFLKGYFIFSYGTGAMIASGINSTAINTLDTATAESKPDTLYRVLPRGDTLIAAGSQSIEFWGVNGEASGFPFSPIATHERGIIHRYAIAGHEEGFGYGIFFVADDFSVRELEGYASKKISTPDLDRLIEAVSDKSTIQCSVFVSQGHPFLVVQCAAWTWVCDVINKTWHERKSYNIVRWKGLFPVKAFDQWMCGALSSAKLFQIDHDTYTEDSEPLIPIIESAPMGNFPKGACIDRLDLFFTAGVGNAAGADPIETNPRVLIFFSDDLGLSWSDPWEEEFGPQGENPNVTINGLGHCGPKGFKIKISESDPVHFAMIGGTYDARPLRN
jgi:hypothetical protein